MNEQRQDKNQRFGLLSMAQLVGACGGAADGTARGDFQVIDSRTRAEYDRGHIPGAILIEWEDWCETAPRTAGAQLGIPGYWGKLADPMGVDAASKLGQHGICAELPIVVYADGVSSKGRDGRIAWMLLYFGATEVYLLDGGWSAWCSQGGAIETTPVLILPRRFNLQLRAERRILLDQMSQTVERAAQQYGTATLLDTRGVAEYIGDCYDYQPRKGHLPDSVLFPFQDYYLRNGAFADKETYLKRFKGRMKDRPDAPVISYCEVGLRASTMALLHELYTGQVVRVYDGSVMEWSHQRQLPMIKRGTEFASQSV